MPAIETSVSLEVKQIQSQEEAWTTQLVNGGATDVSVNALHRISGSGDAKEMEPERLAEMQTETTAVSVSNDEKLVSDRQPVVNSLVKTESQNNQTLTVSSCNAPGIVSKTPFSATPVTAPKSIVAPGVMNAHILNNSTNVQSAVSSPVTKMVVTAGPAGNSSSVVVANNVNQGITSGTPAGTQPVVTVSSSGQAKVGMSLASTSQAGLATVTAAAQVPKVTRVATITQTPGKGAVIALPRTTTLQQNGAPRTPPTTSVQLPANFQIPQGMVLIRSDSGQLMLVSQQALAQAQAQGIVPRANAAASGPTVRVAAPQASSQATTAAVIRNSEVTPVIKAPPPPSSTTVTSFQKMSVLKAAGGAVSTATGQVVRPAVPVLPAVTPAKTEAPKATPTVISAETLENVKKCKNFLVTLIKLASSGTHSAEMAKNVKELVKSLLDGNIEPEEFTDRLYTELKSSPQPYLVPFLKRSLPAVRQLTPNSQLFIQQCALPKPPAASQQVPKPAPAVLATQSKPAQPSLVMAQSPSTAQPLRSNQLVIQQPRGVVIKQSVTGPHTSPYLRRTGLCQSNLLPRYRRLHMLQEQL
ncbi:hypothetical protein AGOR_G00176540 [Albula goreensis]|uniref:TAFH domain-containing protein n=1 Tax=Albula goreensis TaxID=1534307 RepID=A0A8T3D0F6_9TELE|nr:hypothetical protein AGOR_G00176540 [Albula goreensis]